MLNDGKYLVIFLPGGHWSALSFCTKPRISIKISANSCNYYNILLYEHNLSSSVTINFRLCPAENFSWL